MNFGRNGIVQMVSTDYIVLLYLPCFKWFEEKNKAECIHICKGHSQSVDTLAVDSSKTKVIQEVYYSYVIFMHVDVFQQFITF